MTAEGIKIPPTFICVVCQDELWTDKMDNRAVTMTCGHAFHPKCIREWIIKKSGNEDENRAKTDCPNCYCKIALNDTRPLFLNVEEDNDGLSRQLQDLEDAQIKLATSESNLMEQRKLNKDLKLENVKERMRSRELQKQVAILQKTMDILSKKQAAVPTAAMLPLTTPPVLVDLSTPTSSKKTTEKRSAPPAAPVKLKAQISAVVPKLQTRSNRFRGTMGPRKISSAVSPAPAPTLTTSLTGMSTSVPRVVVEPLGHKLKSTVAARTRDSTLRPTKSTGTVKPQDEKTGPVTRRRNGIPAAKPSRLNL